LSSTPVSDSGSVSDPGPTLAASVTLAGAHARALALGVGFTEAGLVALPYAAEIRDAARFEQWIGAGRGGTMRYLERVAENGRLVRARVGLPFPWARSALVCFANYYSAGPRSTEESENGSAWIARYAWSSRKDTNGARRPSDYHKVLLKRLKALDARLHAEFGGFESRAYVDTGPVVERSLAVAAGLGWSGKNTCLIHPRLGSFGFLAVLLTSLEVSPKGEAAEPIPNMIPDRCGTCTRCIDACPTHALDVPYQMNATRCIAYLTIEHQGPIAEELMPGMGRQVFGCDICQDVCPWNRKAPIATDPDLEARPELVNPTLEWLAAMGEAEFEKNFNGSPVRRAGFNGLRRNVAIAMGNSGLTRFTPRLDSWAEAADEGLRSAARWALEKLRGERGGSDHSTSPAIRPE
jgi:epoxyqueuosine reductase